MLFKNRNGKKPTLKAIHIAKSLKNQLHELKLVGSVCLLPTLKTAGNTT